MAAVHVQSDCLFHTWVERNAALEKLCKSSLKKSTDSIKICSAIVPTCAQHLAFRQTAILRYSVELIRGHRLSDRPTDQISVYIR